MSTSSTVDDVTEGLDARRAVRRALVFLAFLVLLAVALRALPRLGEVPDRFTSAAPAWLNAAVLWSWRRSRPSRSRCAAPPEGAHHRAPLLDAGRLLRCTTLSVGEIAYRAGYTNRL